MENVEYDDILLGYGLSAESEFTDADFVKAAAILYYSGFVKEVDWDCEAASFMKEVIDFQDKQMLAELQLQGRAYRSFRETEGE